MAAALTLDHLRHRVAGYRAGDLEARYPRLDVEEDFFVNYGFLPGCAGRHGGGQGRAGGFPAALDDELQRLQQFLGPA